MDYYDIVTEPNVIHYFLANAIIHGNNVITTNFDYMIERALMEIIDKEKQSNILPVITKQDFLEYLEPRRLIKRNYYLLYKMHGSKKNIITMENTLDSLITTMSALGKEREKGKTFTIEPYKKPAIYNLMKQRIKSLINKQ